MITNFKKISLVSLVVVLGVFVFSFDSKAATCGARSAIGNSPPYWGTVSSQNVVSSTGSQVRISVKGEDGCAGQTAEYQIKKGSSIVSTISVSLVKGAPVSGQQDVYTLYSDWTINLNNDDYKIKLLKVGGRIYSSNDSSNILTVGTSQACNLNKVYASPNGGKTGDNVKLTVEALGSCQGWGVTVTSNLTTGGINTVVFNGSEQKFPSGSNKLEWNWALPALVAGSEQASYKIVAHLGSQNLESQAFLVTSAGSGQKYSCNSSNQCVANPNGTYTTTNCDNRCTTGTCGGAGQPACPPGEDQGFSFSIPNPLKGGADDFSELVKIIAQWIFNLAIPIAVAMIVYSGILFLTAAGEPAKVTKAKDVLKYAVIGLAIILIGSGFVTLIQSILDLGAPPTNSNQPMLPVSEGVACRGGADCPQGFSCDLTSGTCFASSVGAVGSGCSADRDCFSGLECNSICQRPSGNLQGEPCAGGRNCAEGLGCDASGDSVQVIGGQNRGTCR